MVPLWSNIANWYYINWRSKILKYSKRKQIADRGLFSLFSVWVLQLFKIDVTSRCWKWLWIQQLCKFFRPVWNQNNTVYEKYWISVLHNFALILYSSFDFSSNLCIYWNEFFCNRSLRRSWRYYGKRNIFWVLSTLFQAHVWSSRTF